MHSLTFYKISLGFSILEWGWQPNKEGLKQTCVKNCEDSEIVPYLKLVNWPTIVSWMLAEATRFLWQRQKSSWQRIHIYSNSPSPWSHMVTPRSKGITCIHSKLCYNRKPWAWIFNLFLWAVNKLSFCSQKTLSSSSKAVQDPNILEKIICKQRTAVSCCKKTLGWLENCLLTNWFTCFWIPISDVDDFMK